MEEKIPNYYAIIPANVRYDDELKPNEKLLYGEIVALCSKNGECWASNSYFASLYKVSNRSITDWLSHLNKRQYIKLETKKDKRIISLINFIIPRKNLPYGIEENFSNTIEENFQYNNTSNINNTRINNKEIIKEIIDYLNDKGGTSFTTTNKRTVSLINARINQGYTLDDFKDVIWHCWEEWVIEPKKFSNGKMSDTYFRPSTLFNETNFENYLQEYRKQIEDE